MALSFIGGVPEWKWKVIRNTNVERLLYLHKDMLGRHMYYHLSCHFSPALTPTDLQVNASLVLKITWPGVQYMQKGLKN